MPATPKYEIVYQSRDMDMTSGGVYTQYIMASDATTADLPTDCRVSSIAYQPSSNTLYMLDIGPEWVEIGGSAESADDNAEEE
jgi:hypothetical protein